MVKLPKQVQVGGKIYTVVFPYVFTERIDLSAQACHITNKLRVAEFSPTSGESYADDNIEEAFWHEVLHCIDKVYNNDELEEGTVNRLALGIQQVLSSLGFSFILEENNG